MALQYRFERSFPVLDALSQTILTSLPPLKTSRPTETVDSFEYIDKALGILGQLQRNQDNQVRHEFDQQRRFITDKFQKETYQDGERDTLVSQRFLKLKEQLEHFKEEVGQRFDRMEAKMDTYQKQVGQRFEEMNARMFNALSYRAHHPIHPVAVFEGGIGLNRPDERHFPRTIKEFWKLQSNRKG